MLGKLRKSLATILGYRMFLNSQNRYVEKENECIICLNELKDEDVCSINCCKGKYHNECKKILLNQGYFCLYCKKIFRNLLVFNSIM